MYVFTKAIFYENVAKPDQIANAKKNLTLMSQVRIYEK